MSSRGRGAVRVGSVVIDCNDFTVMMAFWRDALGYEARDEPEEDWVVLRDPDDAGVHISLQKVPEPRIGKNRLHLDLYTDDPEGEIGRCWRSEPGGTRGSRSRARTSSPSRTPSTTCST